MKVSEHHLFCSLKLLRNIDELNEIRDCIDKVKWAPDFQIAFGNSVLRHQAAYNRAFEIEFSKYKWEKQPVLCNSPKLKGDFRKSDVFVEIQFGNSSTLYRDYYKFHYGLTHGLLALAVLRRARFFLDTDLR